MLTWQCEPFSKLRNDSLYALLKARQEVFIVEQNCPFLDADGIDQQCWHLLGWLPGIRRNELVAYSRLVPPGIKYEEASIGRVITTALGRGRGFGKELMQQSVARISILFPGTAIRIGAQQHLENFYRSFGFKTASDPYLEDGILHVEMLKF